MIGTGGLFTWISYIAPLMTEVSHFSADKMFIIMVIAGLGMVAGNYAGGKLADRFQPENVCAALLLAMTIVLLAIYFFSYIQTVSLILTFLAGALSIALAAPIQILMIRTAYKAEMLGASLTQAAFNIGNSLGAFFGGLPIAAGYGFQSPVLVGSAMAITGLLITLFFIRTNKKRTFNTMS
jgi:DHA1 family arabinose polymer transporter-like MFS transporter